MDAATRKTRIALWREKGRCKDREGAKQTWMDDREQKQNMTKRAWRRLLPLAMASFCLKIKHQRVETQEYKAGKVKVKVKVSTHQHQVY
jgi:hypothetical protein